MIQSRYHADVRNGDGGVSPDSAIRLRDGRTRTPTPVHMPAGASVFSARDTLRHGVMQHMMLGLLAVSLGTTGAMVLNGLVRKVRAERRRLDLPSAFDYLMVDAAARQPDMDATNFYQLAGGIDGSGTDPRRGRELFRRHRNYQEMRAILNNRVLGLMRADAEQMVLSSRKALDMLLIAGNGGTSGGSLSPAIGLLHDVAQDRHIEEPHIYVVIIGAEIALRDKDRQVTLQQQHVVRATAGDNLRSIIGGMAQDGTLQESRPDGTTFSVKAAERVWSVTVADQSNGFADHATVAELAHMLSDALYLRFFTQAGAYLAERIRDPRHLGDMGLGHA